MSDDTTTAPTLAASFATAASRHLASLREGEQRVRSAGDIDGVHLMRTSCRRLRATAKYLGGHLQRAERRSLQSGLRSLMAALGPVRDLGALRREIESMETLGDREAAELAEAVDQLIAKASKRMNEAFDGPDYARLLRELVAACDVPGDTMPASLAGPVLIGRALADTLRLKPAQWTGAGDEALHTLRKGIKKLRYALEAFAPTYGRPVTRAIERCRALQESLGTLQDATVFASLLRDVRTFAAGQFVATMRLRANAALQRLPELWEETFGPKGMARLGGHLFRRVVKKPPAAS